MTRWAVGLWFVASTAVAAPSAVLHQGRLLDAQGAPINGTKPVVVAIYPSASGGTAVASQSATMTFEDGYYSVEVPSVEPVDLAGDRWLSVTVDGVELPRQPLRASPFAVMAAGATFGDVDTACNAGTTSLHGTIRYRNHYFEGCTPTGWRNLNDIAPFVATGGAITTVGSDTVHTFTSSGTFTVSSGGGTVQVLVVAGGGGGGGRSGGGGGGGGVIYNSAFSVVAGQSYTVTVGQGGAGGGVSGTKGANGENSVFGPLTAFGGGGGGSDNPSPTSGGLNGGSGGGAQYNGTAGTGTVGQGFNGASGTGSSPYNSGGGGGAGGAGFAGTNLVAGNGGVGASYNITGTSLFYGGGGGGGDHVPCDTANGQFSLGGSGVGGNGGVCGGSNPGQNGVANTGGGGGGGASPGGNGGVGGNGGSGVVIVRYTP